MDDVRESRDRSKTTSIVDRGVDMDEKLRIWHPSVHRRMREQLYYFLIRVDRYYSSGYLERIKFRISEELKLGSYCLYEIFGAFDVLVRVWVNPTMREDLVNVLSENVRAITEFSVDAELEYWCFPITDTTATRQDLSGITRNSIIKTQRGDTELLKQFLDAGLLAEVIPRRGNNTIKFFVAISPPALTEGIALQILLRDLREVTLDHKGIDDPSLYVGSGFAWALIKATTADVYAMQGLVRAIANKVEHYNSFTTTYIVCERYPVEECGIGQGTLGALEAWNPDIEAWLPELYKDLPPGSTLKMDMERFLTDNFVHSSLDDQDLAHLKNFFRGVVQKDRSMATAFGMALYSQFEGDLRDNIGEMMSKVYGAQNVGRKLSEFDLPTETRRMTLREVLTVYSKTIGDRYPDRRSDLLPVNPDKIEETRNWLAHRRRDPIENWQEIGAALKELVEKGRALIAFVNGLSENEAD